MKISFENKIVLGYIINLAVVFALGIIYWKQMPISTNNTWHWVSLILIVLSIAMLTIVFFILKAQFLAKKKFEQQLMKNENLLQSIINNTTNPISIKKLNGEYILVNKQYQLIFESKEKNLIGKTNHDFLPKEVADAYRSSDLEAIKAEKEIHLEETLEQSDGIHTYLSVKFPLFDTSNRVYAIGNISTDITERKKMEQSLKAADTFFNLSIDSLVIASKHKFIKVNPSLSQLLGYSNSELLEKPFTDFIYPEDIPITQNEIEKLEKGTNLINFKNRWVCKDNSIKWLSWNATVDLSAGTFYAIVKDITQELKLQEEEEEAINEIYESQQKLNMVLENISDGVIVANTDKQVILANHVANDLFRIEDDTKIPFNFSENFEVLFPDGKTTFPVQNLPTERALVGEITDDIDVLLRDLDTNTKHRVLLSGKPILNSKSQVVAVVVTIKDISQYKKLEAELEKKDLKSRTMIGFKKNKHKNKA